MGGTADGGQTAGQGAPEDLMSVREAAQAVGFTPPTVQLWIRSGRLIAQPSPRGRRVSLAAVRAVCAPCDPQTPPEARLVYEVAQAARVDKDRIRIWVRQGLLPSWSGPHGMLVREADVRAVAQQQAEARRRARDRNDSPQPGPEALVSVREAAHAVGLTPGVVHSWIARGMLPVRASRQGRRVSLSAVHALCAAPEPQAPDEARRVSDVALAVDVPPWRMAAWLRRGLLPSWQSSQGLLVRETDVRALAQLRVGAPSGDKAGA